MTEVTIKSKKEVQKAPVAKPIDVPFWSLREGIIARECIRCGHRGYFPIEENMPFQISSSVVCMACGAITFDAVLEDPTPQSIEEIIDKGAEDAASRVDE